jgi:hypothetical protein
MHTTPLPDDGVTPPPHNQRHLRMPSLQKKYTLDQVPQAFAESSTGTVKGKLVIDVENSTNSVIYQQL